MFRRLLDSVGIDTRPRMNQNLIDDYVNAFVTLSRAGDARRDVNGELQARLWEMGREMTEGELRVANGRVRLFEQTQPAPAPEPTPEPEPIINNEPDPEGESLRMNLIREFLSISDRLTIHIAANARH